MAARPCAAVAARVERVPNLSRQRLVRHLVEALNIATDDAGQGKQEGKACGCHRLSIRDAREVERVSNPRKGVLARPAKFYD